MNDRCSVLVLEILTLSVITIQVVYPNDKCLDRQTANTAVFSVEKFTNFEGLL